MRVLASRPLPASISIVSIYFQDLKFGHEGPSYFTAKRAPLRGQQEIVEVTLHGQEAIRTVQFVLFGEAGQPLAYPVAFRGGNGADDNEYMLRVDVPVQPFRFGIRGVDFQGQPYERIDRRVFRPVDGVVPAPELPPDLSSEQAAFFRQMLDSYRAELQSQFEAASKAHPDGAVALGRSEVLESGYEPLRSTVGNEIGLRLRLTVRFAADGAYSVAPLVFPIYRLPDWRANSELKVLNAEAVPAPQSYAADGLADVLRYGGAANYKAGQIYRFTFDLTPSFILPNVDRTRFCVHSQLFRTSSKMDVWDAIRASSTPVRYHVEIWSLDFRAETMDAPPLRTYYESFLREGAQDCGPLPTNRF